MQVPSVDLGAQYSNCVIATPSTSSHASPSDATVAFSFGKKQQMELKRWFWAFIAVLFAFPIEYYVNRSRFVCGNGFEGFPQSDRSSELLVKLKRLRFGNDTLQIFPTQSNPPQVQTLTQSGALWMALNLRELALLPGDRLVIRDGEGNERIRADSSNVSHLAPWNTSSMHMWDHPVLVLGNQITVEYYPSLSTLVLPICRPQRDNAVAILDSYFFAVDKSGRLKSSENGSELGEELESTIGGSSELKEAVCYKKRAPQMYVMAKPVVRLLIRKQEHAQDETSEFTTHSAWYFCTGWLVGKDNHLLTNYHCIFKALGQQQQSLWSWKTVLMPLSSKDQYLTNADANFMAETKSCKEVGVMGEKRGVVESTQAHVIAANQALDYCLLRLVPTEKDTDLSDKYGYLTLRASGPVDKEPIYIPQHPNGEPKEIASTKNGMPAVIRVALRAMTRRGYLTSASAASSDSGYNGGDPNVFYNADTMPGSSGSPVLSQVDNNVIALHHAGTISSTAFSSGASDSSSSSDAVSQMNSGIRIDAIVQDLQRRRLLPPCALPVKCLTQSSGVKARRHGSQCCSRDA